jgi:Fur family transcriptional regulator, zinc uptake regulator
MFLYGAKLDRCDRARSARATQAVSSNFESPESGGPSLPSETSQPLGAYELLSRLESRLRRTLRAPTIYRALEFLGDLGLVDRIESRNALVLAGDLERPHCSVFFLCNRCNTSVAVEDPGVALLIAENAATLGFQVTKPIIECNGICAGCAGARPTRQATTSKVGRFR